MTPKHVAPRQLLRQCDRRELLPRYKAELLEGGTFADVDQARSETFTYIEGYHNRARRHSALNYKSPDEFACELIITKKGWGSERIVSCPT